MAISSEFRRKKKGSIHILGSINYDTWRVNVERLIEVGKYQMSLYLGT